MDAVTRVVIHDQEPLFDRVVIEGWPNRLALFSGLCALGLQGWALAQVIAGRGLAIALFDHVSFAVVGLLWLILGALVFVQRHAGWSGRAFLLTSSAGAVFLAFGSLYGADTADALVFAAGLLLFPPLLLLFVRGNRQERVWQRGELLILLPALALIWPGAESLAGGTVTLWWKLGLGLVGLYLVVCIMQAYRDQAVARNPEEAAQRRALVTGLVAGTVPGIAVFVVPLMVQGQLLTAVTWLPLIILLFILAMSYSALLFEFAEAELILRRGVVYGMLTLAIIAIYGALGGLLLAGRSTVANPGGGLSFVAVTILVGAAFTPVRRFARRTVDWLLYDQRIDRWQLLQDLSARLSIVMQPDEVGDVLVREVTRALHLRGAFLLRRSEGGDYELRNRYQAAVAVGRRGVPESMVITRQELEAAVGPRSEWLMLIHRRPLSASRREQVPGQYRVLDSVRAALSIPLISRSGIEAVLCLQPKISHDALDTDDLELLAPVIRQATAALDNALLFASVQERVAELREAYARIAQEQEAERARLARELHDGTAQELAGLITLAAVAGKQLHGDEDDTRRTLERLRQRAEEAYQGVRRASHALRPLMLDDFGLVPTLERYIEDFEEAAKIPVSFEAGMLGRLPAEVELALFRTAQECMENVRKHSGARRARLGIQRENGSVILEVSDDGRGLGSLNGQGIGLAGIKERIAAVGGEVTLWSRPGEGVRLRAAVPAGGDHGG